MYRDGITIYPHYVNKVAAEKYNMQMLEKLGFDNTYAVAVPQEIADKYNLEKVSDLYLLQISLHSELNKAFLHLREV